MDTFNEMLVSASLQELNAEETAAMLKATSDAKRGDSFNLTLEILKQAAIRRAYVCINLSTDSDAYFLLLSPTVVEEKWRGQYFGKNYPILS